MPKVTIRFDLPKEVMEFRQSVNGVKAHAALWDFSMWLRNQLKYEKLPSPARKALEAASKEFYEIAGDLLEDIE